MKSVSARQTIEGLIIRTFPSGEADLVLRILTPTYGKIAAIAKYARKSKNRFAGSLDLFERAQFELSGDLVSDQKLLVLINVSDRKRFSTIRNDLLKITLASVLCEAYDVLNLPNQDLSAAASFEAAELTLLALDEAKDSLAVFRACYFGLATLLSQSGFLDPGTAPAPSAKGLLHLVEEVERCSERQLLTKPALYRAMEELRRSHKAGD